MYKKDTSNNMLNNTNIDVISIQSNFCEVLNLFKNSLSVYLTKYNFKLCSYGKNPSLIFHRGIYFVVSSHNSECFAYGGSKTGKFSLKTKVQMLKY